VTGDPAAPAAPAAPAEPERDRLAALEQRVAALERALADGGRGGDVSPSRVAEDAAGDADRFWALQGLRERAPADAGGAVLFTGVVRTPDGATYQWQEAHAGDDLLGRSWEEAGAALEALGSPVRMLLLREVLHGRATAADLAELPEFGTSGQVYHHLRRLTAAGWLRSAARGRYVVPPERIVPLLAAIAAVQR
jgi:DNA-binding transcriptional ArsR family regulator